jgi:hypothetical protein
MHVDGGEEAAVSGGLSAHVWYWEIDMRRVMIVTGEREGESGERER